jgi:hypothetical protein
MDKLGLVLLAFSFVCFCISAWLESDTPGKLRAVGLAFFAAAVLFGNIGVLFRAQ